MCQEFYCAFFLDNRRGSCWMTVNNSQCENDIKTPMLKSECCGSVGKAWGSPCQLCSEIGMKATDFYFFVPSLLVPYF